MLYTYNMYVEYYIRTASNNNSLSSVHHFNEEIIENEVAMMAPNS